ncbi:hypothetical protein ACQ4LE_009677 [Meloidogyne hapla]|uniref:Uncharacterized protein n=1 Tax=Meloidogyne hapla TaxID=6305 RepID=A0A1I8BGH4_MELHA
MLRFIVSTNLFKYFGQQSRAFTTSNIKLCRYSESIDSSNYESDSLNNITNESDVGNRKEKNKTAVAIEKLNIGINDILLNRLNQGISGRRTINLIKIYRGQNTEWKWKHINLPNLLMPNYCYNFVRALDEIIIACDGKKFVDILNPNEELASAEINTDFYDISLNLIRDKKCQLSLEFLQKRKTEDGIINRPYYIQINALPWIRKTTAQLLKEYDDSEKLPPMPIVDFPFSYKKKEKPEFK